jgi:hypothetical protein
MVPGAMLGSVCAERVNFVLFVSRGRRDVGVSGELLNNHDVRAGIQRIADEGATEIVQCEGRDACLFASGSNAHVQA